MYREWKKIEFPNKYYIWIWEQQDWEADQEIDGKMRWERVEEYLVEKGGRKKYITEGKGRTPENGTESSHSARANRMNECVFSTNTTAYNILSDWDYPVHISKEAWAA